MREKCNLLIKLLSAIRGEEGCGAVVEVVATAELTNGIVDAGLQNQLRRHVLVLGNLGNNNKFQIRKREKNK